MKVVHIASGDLWAGAEKQLLSLAEALRALPDTEVEAVILNPGTLAERLAAGGISTTVLDEGQRGGRRLLRELTAHLRRSRPALVHTHRLKENILGGLAAATLAIPSLRTQHGGQEHPRAWHDMRRLALGTANYLAGSLLQRRIIAVSSPLAGQLQRSYGRRRVAMIPNGIEPGPEPPPRSWTERSGWTIGIVGRLVPVKRVDLFLRIAARLATDFPQRPLQFHVIGDGPLRASLEQQARQLASPIDLRFLGHMDDAEQAIAGLDLLVLCSDHEGLPMVALEAMKAGTVVVTHAIGGLPELLEQGRCGVIADAHTDTAFAGAIGQLLRQPQRATALSAAARERLVRHYSSTAMACQYRALYAELVS
jgi:glycosyltransferase involved in cell wall biosynthesis